MKQKSQLILVIALLFCSSLGFAQPNGTISLGPDLILPSCQSCDTLRAVTTPAQAGTLNYAVNQIPYTPYPFVGSNIIPISGDDIWSGIINMPFDFCFFGNTYNQFIVGSNGLLSFNIANASAGNAWAFGTSGTPLPTTTYPDAMNSIMCPYHDLFPPAGGTISWQVYGVAPNRILVVSWNLLPMFLTTCNLLLNTQQIALYEGTNKIETYIANKDLCTAWNSGQAIHGIQNSTGTVAFIVPGRNLPSQWTVTNDAWEFQPSNGGGGGGGSTNAVVDWFDMNGNLLASNVDSIVVCPYQTQTFMARATYNLCGGFEYAYDTIQINKLPPLSIDLTNNIDVNCFGGADGSFNVSVAGGSGSYSTTMNGNSIAMGLQSNLIAGTYNVVATDAYNCSVSSSTTINEPTELQLSIVSQEDVPCKYQDNGKVHLSATGSVPGYQYWFTGSNPTNNSDFNYLVSGNYTFHAIDNHGCEDSLSTYVAQPDSLLTVTQIAHEATCINKKDGSVEAIASGGVPTYQYEWNTKPTIQTSQTATDLETGVYHVLVTDANGCVTATQIQVEQQLCCQIFLPDAFTPNNDQTNDVFHVIEYGGGVLLGEMRIYNRWGQELFSTREISKGWDGTFKGVDQNSDTYHYIVQYQCNDKGIISQKVAKGDFILIR